MSDRWKTVLLILVLAFYILLTAMGVADSSNSSTDSDLDSTNSTDRRDEVIIRNETINVTSFMMEPRVRAFREMHHVNFVGDFRTEALKSSNLFKEVKYPYGQFIIWFSEDILNVEDWRNYRRLANTTISVLVVDGKYLDDVIYKLEFTDPIYENYNTSTMVFSASNRTLQTNVVDKLELSQGPECRIAISVNFTEAIQPNTTAEKPYNISETAPIDVYLTSENCNFAIKTTLYRDMRDVDKKAINYSLLLTLIAGINLYSIAKMIRQAVDSAAYASQLSLLTIGFITVWDTYVCIAHLFLALTRETLFHFFIMPTFWYFILFSIFELKLLIVIWKARYENQMQTYEQTRRAMANFHIKFYLAMVVVLALLYNYILYNWFLLLMNLFVIPQIVHNTIRGGRIEFDQTYMFNVIGLHAFLPLYFRGCPSNIMDLRPSTSFCLGLIFVIGVQILFVYYQSIHGSKFFVPARFLPAQYDYLYNLPEDLESGNDFDDCAVCMSALHHEPGTSMAETTHKRLLMNRLKPKEGQVMRTPCNHKFHVTCLLEWMAIKTECPTCRSQLPLLE